MDLNKDGNWSDSELSLMTKEQLDAYNNHWDTQPTNEDIQREDNKRNDLNGDGGIDQYEWSLMSREEQRLWTENYTSCLDSGRTDCE